MQPIRLVQEHADHLAPWLAFFGALIVALIAAVTAQSRLRAQLYAEDKRHRDRLSFERGEVDRAELRTILDALAEHTYGVQEAIVRVITTAELLVGRRRVPNMTSIGAGGSRSDRSDSGTRSTASDIRFSACAYVSEPRPSLWSARPN